MIKRSIKTLLTLLNYEVVKKNRTNRICWPPYFPNPQTFFEVDKDFHRLYDLAQSKTQMSFSDNPFRRQRHYVLTQLLKYVDLKAGDVCELGCWRGLSAYQIARYLKSKSIDTTFHIFDSFEGLSEFEPNDKDKNIALDYVSKQKYFSCQQEIVQSNLSEFTFIRYYKGWFPHRFREVENLHFSFIHIDVDLYQPTRDSLQFFYPRLIKHGIMVFDDYGSLAFPGAKQAVDEYLRTLDNPFFISFPSGGAFLIKDF